MFRFLIDVVVVVLLLLNIIKQSDLTKQWKWFKNLKKQLLETCAREVDTDDLDDKAEDEKY